MGNNKEALIYTALAVLCLSGAMRELGLSGIISVQGPKGTVDISVKANKSTENRNIIDNMDEIADDIININKQYSDGYQMNNSVKSILNSASYYDNKYEQVAAVIRSITDHAFANGNKRTALDSMNMLLDDFGLNNSLTDAQKWNLIYDIAEGRLNSVKEIANILKGY